MKRNIKIKYLSIFLFLLFILLISIPISYGYNVRYLQQYEISFGSGNTLYVGGSGPDNYTFIQDAINDSVDWDKIFVYDDLSPYSELLTVDNSISLIGENQDTTVIGGKDKLGGIIVNANFVKISDFTLEEIDGDAIKIHSDNNSICNNTINNNNYGMVFYDSSDNIIAGNTISSNTCFSIMFYNTNNTTVKDNILSNNGRGLSIEGHNNNILSNSIFSNKYCGIILRDSNLNTIKNNIITNNDARGIHIHNSNSNTIAYNSVGYHPDDGILLCDFSCNNKIIGNNIENNVEYGVYIFYKSKNNIIYYNNFIENQKNVYDLKNGESNYWDDGEYGNYWSDYEQKYPNAHKLWLKGIWNEPYWINGGNNKDDYPLFMQWQKTKPRDLINEKKSNDFLFLKIFENMPILKEVIFCLLL